MDIEKEIDYRIQLSGRRLEEGQEEIRAWWRRQIEFENARRAEWEATRPPPTFPFKF